MKKGSRGKRQSWFVDVDAYKVALDTSTTQRSSPTGTDTNAKTEWLEKSMLHAAEIARKEVSEKKDMHTDNKNIRIKQLNDERRRLHADQTQTLETKKTKRRELCKEIQKLVRQRLREQKTQKISNILSQFRGLRQIAAITGTTKQTINSLVDSEGNEVAEKQALSDVFAKFYEELYASRVSTVAPQLACT